ncbi:MAG: proton-conducting transporter membrane subunit [Robiginitalea sp.]
MNPVKLLSKKSQQPADGNIGGTTSFSFSKMTLSLLWLLFLANLANLLLNAGGIEQWYLADLLRFNGFSALIWTVVTFFSALVCSYALKYLNGFRYRKRFMVLCLGFTFSVMLLVISYNVILLLLSWLAMGLFMSGLIGVDREWGEAREASRFTRRYFLTGTFFLSAGVLLLAVQSGAFTLGAITDAIGSMPGYILLAAAICVITAAIVQSAIYPFHRWLLSAMTAPTPASALMHAGFVNGAGILLALFATLIFASKTLNVLLIVGGLTAIIAQFTKLLQVNVKHRLACSTIAQMGFMIMQCGLGFFNAAVAHLILHGFYKAYLFLASGEEIAHANPQKPLQIRIKPLQAVIVLIFGLLGAVLFSWLTGKGTEGNSGIFLTLIVAITVGQATYNIVKQRSLSVFQKFLAPAALTLLGIGIYALMFNGVTTLMADMPMVATPLPLSAVEIGFGIVFLIGFFIMKLGVYRRLPWVYVKLMNLSQPHGKSILLYKSKSV